MDLILKYILPVIVGYLFGSFSFGILLSRFGLKDDVRKHGSKSSGMTNMLRTYGYKWAAFVFIGDFIKGILAVLIMRVISNNFLDGSLLPIYLAGLFAVLGHMFPVYFGFKGGKGVTTAAAVMIMLEPLAGLACLTIFLVIFLLTKIISISSIIASAVLPFAIYFICTYHGENPLIPVIFTSLIAIAIIFMHRANIKRLIKGEEKKITLQLPKKKEGKEDVK